MAARRLIWSKEAKIDTKEIFDYWNHRNKSKNYSRRLGKTFISIAKRLLQNPLLGLKTSLENLFYVIVEKKFLMIYRVTDEAVEIIAIWDGRRNPDDFEKLIKKR